ncbi:hypothetical protein LPJ61_000571, partial [Coemansia biformis]
MAAESAGRPEEQEAKSRGKPKGRPAPVPESYTTLLAGIVAKGVADSDALEANEDQTAIRRKGPFVESDEWFWCTVHVKGLPYGKECEGLIEDLTEYFVKTVGDVATLRLRRNPRTKAFKGNALVEFTTEALAEAAVAAGESLEFEMYKLEPALLTAYHDEKLAADEFIQPELQKPGGSYPTYEVWCAAHGHELPVPLDSEKKRKMGSSSSSSSSEPEVVPGVLVSFSGVAGEVGISQLKEAFGALGEVKYIEHEQGAAEGIMRFKEPVAQEVVEKSADGVALGEGVSLALAVVDEEAQKAFFECMHTAAAAAVVAATAGTGASTPGTSLDDRSVGPLSPLDRLRPPELSSLGDRSPTRPARTMVHEPSLDMYVFDYIKRRGYHQTALCLANECKGLPLVIAADDPQLGILQGQSPHGARAPPVPSSASPTTSDTTGPASASAAAAPPPTYLRVPSIILPYNSLNGLLFDWWIVFLQVYAASWNLLQAAGVLDGARMYVQHQAQAQAQHQAQHQAQRLPSTAALNANGKRAARDVPLADGANPPKRGRLAGEQSPQSAALAERYALSDDMDPRRLADQQSIPPTRGDGMPTIPRGPGVNIGPGGAHMLSEDYSNYL